MIRQYETGFSAVELMISLFIAVAFIASGYQLYSVIIKDGAAANYRSQASNIAYANLRSYSALPTGTCSAQATTTIALTGDQKAALPNGAVASYSYTCPYPGTTVWSVTSKVVYGTPSQEVVHALFVTR